jgi:hypothetical protein
VRFLVLSPEPAGPDEKLSCTEPLGSSASAEVHAGETFEIQ